MAADLPSSAGKLVGEHVGGPAEQRKTTKWAPALGQKLGEARPLSKRRIGSVHICCIQAEDHCPASCLPSCLQPHVGHEAVDPKHRVCVQASYTVMSTAPPLEVEGSESQWSAPTPITHLGQWGQNPVSANRAHGHGGGGWWRTQVSSLRGGLRKGRW